MMKKGKITMDTHKILGYLKGLKENNNREWFHAHKREQQEANEEFLQLVRALQLELGKSEPALLAYEPKDLTFKMVRDTRFSKDKSPYNPAFRVHISTGGKLPVPVGYFLVIKPGESFLGGGLFADMFKEATESIRQAIVQNGAEWERIIHEEEFCRYFTVEGTALKKVPAGYDPAHPQAEYLKYKSWYLEYRLEDAQLEDGETFLDRAVSVCSAMKPFNDFLNRALKDFQMPQRP